MSKTDQPKNNFRTHLSDRFGLGAAAVDRSPNTVADVQRRAKLRKGDRATHRAYHSHYEDLLN